MAAPKRPKAVKKKPPKKKPPKKKAAKKKPKPPIDWEQLRHDYESNELTVEAIKEKHGIGWRALKRQIKDRGWKLRHPPVPGADRLKALVDKHIIKLEQEFKSGKSRKTSEAQLNRLAALGRTLENIARLEKAASGSDRATEGGAPITDERRRELARRLAALGGASGPSESAEGAA
jgi:hypothetical protein